jgi:hypothetical protein
MYWTNDKENLLKLVKKAKECKLKPDIKVLNQMEINLNLIINNLRK